MTTCCSLDPRTKLFLVACLSSLAVITTHWAFLSGILVVSTLLLLLFGISPREMIKKTRMLLYMVVIIAVMQSIFASSGQVLISLSDTSLITTGGLLMALEFILRMGIIICSAGILSTSNSREIIQGLIQLKLPYEIAFMASLGIRFIPDFAQEFRNTLIAVQLRGVDMMVLPLRQKIEVISILFQPVVVGAIIKSRAMSMSVEMRGFRAYPTRSSYMVLGFRKMDYVVIISGSILTTLILIGYFLLVR